MAMGAFKRDNAGYFGLAALGLAVLAAGPIGLMLAALAGLAGGAAVTAALAAFGPGGMVGGMALAGSLIGAGTVTATAAMLATGATAVGLETDVVRRMAVALAAKRLALPSDHSSWLLFAEIESRLAGELAAIEALSDSSSPTVKQLKAKLSIVQTAIEWMVKRDLAPAVGALHDE